MSLRRISMLFLMTALLLPPAFAGGKTDLQKYFNDMSLRVKEQTDPAAKRALLDQSLGTMTDALGALESSPLVSESDRAGLRLYAGAIREKQDELSGVNGFQRVPDEQLNAFSEYVVQDMEQAEPYINISLVAALLILILVILIL